MADRRFIVVAPAGVSQSWNAGDCCRPATTLGIDDVGLLGALLDDIALRPEVDSSRVFVVGNSNGGMMAYRFACEEAGRLAGLASVQGPNVAGCEPSSALSVMHIAGTGDEVVPYDGGRSLSGVAFASGAFPSTPDTVEATAASMGCSEAVESSEAAINSLTWRGCDDGATVELVTIVGAPHQWPRPPAYDATTQVLDFFGIG